MSRYEFLCMSTTRTTTMLRPFGSRNALRPESLAGGQVAQAAILASWLRRGARLAWPGAGCPSAAPRPGRVLVGRALGCNLLMALQSVAKKCKEAVQQRKRSSRKRTAALSPAASGNSPADDEPVLASPLSPPSPQVFHKEWSNVWKDGKGRVWKLVSIREDYLGQVHEVWARQPPEAD